MNFNNQIHHIPPFPPGGVPTFRAFPTLPPKPARVLSPPSDEPPRASPPDDNEHPIIGSNIFQGVHQQRQHEGPFSPQSPPDDDTAPMPRASAITRRPPLLKKKLAPEDSVSQAAAAPTTVTSAAPEVPPPAAARPLLGSLFGANATKGKKGQSKSAVPVPTKSIVAAAAPPPATIDSIYKKPISPKAPPAKLSSLDTKVKPISKGKSARRKKHDTSDSPSSDSDEVSRRRIKKEAHSSESSDHSSESDGRGSKRSYSTDSDRSKRYRKKKSRRVESRKSRSRSRSNSSDRVARERKNQHLASHAGEGILAPPTGGFRPINSSNYATTPYLGNNTNNMQNAIHTNSMMMNTQQGMHHNQQNSYQWPQNQHDGGQSFDHSATNMTFGDSQNSYANPLPNNGPNSFDTNSVPSKTNNINSQASNPPILGHPPAPAAPSTAGFSPDQWLGAMQKFMEKQSTAPPKGTESDTSVPLLPPPPPPPSTQLVEAIANNVHEHFTNLTAGVYALIDEMRGQRQEAQDALLAQREDARQLMQLHQQESEAHREEIAVLRSEVKLMKGELMARLLQLNGDTFEALAAVLQDPNFAASAILQLTRQRCGGLSGCGSYSFPDPARFAVQGYRKVTLLHMAVHFGRLDVIKAIFVASNPSSAVNPEAVNPEAGLESGKYTALHLAATHSGGPYPDIIRCLVNNGADINCADEEGWTPLMYACRANLMDIANTLLQFRPHQRAAGQYEDEPATGPEVNVNAACVTQGHTSLHFAAMNANADLCNALCLLGANPLALASFGSGQSHHEFGAKKGLTPRASTVTNDAETLKVLMHWENLALASGRSHITFH